MASEKWAETSHVIDDQSSFKIHPTRQRLTAKRRDLLEDAPKLANTDVVYRLSIHRRRDKGSPNQLLQDSYIKQDVPFDIQICADLPPKRRNSAHGDGSPPPQAHRSSTILEIVTHVVDARYCANQGQGRRGLRVPAPAPVLSDLRLTRVLRHELVIHSHYLKDVLHDLVEYYPDAPNWQSQSPVVLVGPFQVLMHHYQDIETWIGAHEKPAVEPDLGHSTAAIQLEHMRVLKRFLHDRFEDNIRPAIVLLSTANPKVEFDMLWYLFRPGTDVYIQTSEGIAVCVVQSVRSDATDDDKLPRRWFLDCWRMATDGARVARVQCIGTLARYAGSRDAITLPICPTDIWDAHDDGARRAKIVERNTIYFEALQKGSLHVQYDGPDLTDGRPVGRNYHWHAVPADFDSTLERWSSIIIEHGPLMTWSLVAPRGLTRCTTTQRSLPDTTASL